MQIYRLALANAWLAISYIDEILANPFAMHVFPTKTNQQGSIACRLLLRQLQKHIEQLDQQAHELDERELPYYFISNSQKWFVSFSHSQRQVAVLVAKVANIGVDIENKPIKLSVAKRFFSQAENQWLNQLDKVEQSNLAKTLLWTLKESYIKAMTNQQNIIHQQNLNLTEGLGVDMLQWLSPNELALLLALSEPYTELCLANAVIGFSPKSQCSWWVGR